MRKNVVLVSLLAAGRARRDGWRGERSPWSDRMSQLDSSCKPDVQRLMM